MNSFVLGLGEVDATQVDLVGGKGAHLGELSRIDGVSVPAGYCVTTKAFRRVMLDAASFEDHLGRLSSLSPDDRDAIRAHGTEIRRIIEGAPVPAEVAEAITRPLTGFDERTTFAVRSSATAEDLPSASFAGQHDSYLNVVGPASVLEHVRRCWASLFTERALTYRLRHGLDHREVQMAVIVQQMVSPQAAGVLFTADPVSSNRTVVSVEATVGLGEALVSGVVSPDVYTVRDGAVATRSIASKLLAASAAPGGGTVQHPIEPELQDQPALSEEQVVRLAGLGRQVEAHFGCPQDIEWCLVDDDILLVQSRPITTLFPIPTAADADNHVYVSVGHQQMMTDAMTPLGLSLFRLTALPPMHEAGGRLFVDVTAPLASPASRHAVIEVLGASDPLIGDALQAVVDRGDFLPSLADKGPTTGAHGHAPAPIDPDPTIVAALVEDNEASVAALEREIRTQSGAALFDFVLTDIEELKRLMFDPQSSQVYMSAMDATSWLNDQLQEWLGEKNAGDVLTQSVPNNVTSEMGLALLDVADAIRPYPEVIEFLQRIETDDFLDEMAELTGGPSSRDAIAAFLDRYGMRCVGEIDITRPRWSECPSALVPVILGNIKNFEHGAGERRFEHGRQEAWEWERQLLERLRALPDGEQKAGATERMIDIVRTFIGYREYPKYGMVRRYFIYKQALLGEADRLVRTAGLGEREDIFFLTFEELREAVQTSQVDTALIARRKESFRSHQALAPPRVLTSDGEAVIGAYRRDAGPLGALVGLPVSTGTVEGRARVILDMADADLEPGDILVTAYTDPSWSPLFITIAGLVTEVGGLMTHGAVIAREYGLPAVVGVEHATQTIQDGQQIRVSGTDGYVEVLA